MNPRILLSFVFSGVLAAPATAAYGPPVLETATEFFAHGDFGGDGRRSYAIIDRASGGMRLANALASGALTMPEARATGLTNITSVAVGRFILSTHDALAVTSPEANRARVVGPIGTPFDAWPPGVGPRHITALGLPGGTSGLDDMIAVTIWNSPVVLSPWWRGFLLNGSLSFSTWKTQYPDIPPESPLAVVMVDGEAATYADLQEDRGNLVFSIYDVQNVSIPVLTQRGGINLGSRVAYGTFNPSHARSVFVFHVPGSGSVQVSTLDASRLLGTLSSHNLSARADWLQPVKAGTAVWLAALSQGGDDLRVYSFNSSSVPALVQTINAPKGLRWTGIVPAADGGWFAASALPGNPSAGFRRFTYQGGATPFVAGTSYDLAPLRTEELVSDVLLFNGKPFIVNDPILRGRYRAGGWTSQLNDNPQFPGSMNATAEAWRGATLGLGNPATAYLGITPSGVTNGMSNQISNNASFYSLDPPIGGLADQVEFDPLPGPQTVAVEVTLSTNDPAATIRYCLGESNRWATYAGPLGPYSSDTTVRAYVASGDTKTPVQSATYTFPSYPGDVDSDGDGVPDFVEKHYGLDPVASGLDSDGDGCPDLQEIMIGTDPNSSSSVPGSAAIKAHSRYFQFAVEPKSHGGAPYGSPLVLAPSFVPDPPVREGTWINVNRPDGTLEFEGNAGLQPGGVMLVELQRSVPAPPLFWVAGTPNRFMIDVEESDRRRGRGIYRILDYTAPPLDPLPKPTLSGTTAEQVSQWVTAVRNHFLANARVSVGGQVSLTETVDLLLAEHALGLVFHSRGWIATPKLSLTPFRGDSKSDRWAPPGVTQPDRHPVDEAWLAELGSAAYGDDGIDWNELLEFIRRGVITHEITRAGLDEFAREVYFVGYHAFDDDRNPFTITPFDALRQFMDSGALPVDYDRKMSTPSGVREAAREYVAAFERTLPTRDHTSSPLVMVANPGFFQDPWIVLHAETGGIAHWLADAQGNPFPQPSGFRILPGSRFLVGGHLADHAGGGKLLMVDSISLLDAPMPAIQDSDENLLGDDWEGFHFGFLGADAHGDTDNDRYSALQEMFENTDPRYASDHPMVAALDLRPPRLSLLHLGNKQFDLSWRWPARYHDRVRFFLEGGDDLLRFDRLEDNIPATSGDLFQINADAEAAAAAYFFRIGFRLR